MVQLGADVPLKGSTYQEIHRDYRPLFTDDFVTPLYALAVNFPLVDVTEENGAFQQARGTHLIPRETALAKIASGEIRMESLFGLVTKDGVPAIGFPTWNDFANALARADQGDASGFSPDLATSPYEK